MKRSRKKSRMVKPAAAPPAPQPTPLETLTGQVAAAARAVADPSGHHVVVVVFEPTLGKWQANWGQLPPGFVGWNLFQMMLAIAKQT